MSTKLPFFFLYCWWLTDSWGWGPASSAYGFGRDHIAKTKPREMFGHAYSCFTVRKRNYIRGITKVRHWHSIPLFQISVNSVFNTNDHSSSSFSAWVSRYTYSGLGRISFAYFSHQGKAFIFIYCYVLCICITWHKPIFMY